MLLIYRFRILDILACICREKNDIILMFIVFFINKILSLAWILGYELMECQWIQVFQS